MAGSINKVILVGNLGKDPEVRSTQDGKEIANLTLATSDSWKDKNTGERRERTEWHRIVIFNDALVNGKLQGPGGALIPHIEARFPGTTGPKGVDRQKLGAAVLGKPDELRALEHIIHPAVYHARQRFLRAHRSRPMVVLDIPLLFEKGGARQVDVTVVVSAPAFLQRRRVLRRKNMTAAKLRHIRHLQNARSCEAAKGGLRH